MELNFKEIRIRNFLSFGNVEEIIPLNKCLYQVIIGMNKDKSNSSLDRNGVGKSTIFEAIHYALFGKSIGNKITLGNTYSAPEFNKKFQENNDIIKYGYLYSNGDLNFKNLTFNSFKLSVSNFNIIQWNTTISNSGIIVNNSLIMWFR